MKETMEQSYQGRCDFLEHVFDNYFGQVWQFFGPYTNNINEFQYLFRFLYPRYVQKFYSNGTKPQELKDKKDKALELFDKPFQAYMEEI